MQKGDVKKVVSEKKQMHKGFMNRLQVAKIQSLKCTMPLCRLKHQKQRSIILNDLDLVVGDDFVVFSNVTKVGKEEIHEKIERIVE